MRKSHIYLRADGRTENHPGKRQNCSICTEFPGQTMLYMTMPVEGEEWQPDTLSLESPHLYDKEWSSKLFCDILEWSQDLRASIERWQECL